MVRYGSVWPPSPTKPAKGGKGNDEVWPALEYNGPHQVNGRGKGTKGKGANGNATGGGRGKGKGNGGGKRQGQDGDHGDKDSDGGKPVKKLTPYGAAMEEHAKEIAFYEEHLKEPRLAEFHESFKEKLEGLRANPPEDKSLDDGKTHLLEVTRCNDRIRSQEADIAEQKRVVEAKEQELEK